MLILWPEPSDLAPCESRVGVILWECCWHTLSHVIFLTYFQLPFAEIAGKTLVMSVYDFDRFSKHDQIGQVVIPLSSLDLCATLEETRDISSPDEEKVRMCYYR